METFREKLEARIVQLKRKLKGYLYVEYGKKENPIPKETPDFPINAPNALTSLYSSYTEVKFSSTMGIISITPYKKYSLDDYQLRVLSPKFEEEFLSNLVLLTSVNDVFYHKEKYDLYFFYEENLLKLNLTISCYLDWSVFFLGIRDFPLFFVENSCEFLTELNTVNQKLNTSFFSEEIIPFWFKENLPNYLEINKPLEVNDRVLDIRHELSGKILEIVKTKAIIEFDCGGMGTKDLRMIVKTIDSIYENIVLGNKTVLDLNIEELKNLADQTFPVHAFTLHGLFDNLHAIKAIYKDLDTKAVFKKSIEQTTLILKKIKEYSGPDKDYNELQSWRYSFNMVFSGLFVSCFEHLESVESDSLISVLGPELSNSFIRLMQNALETDQTFEKRSPIQFFQKALENFSKNDFEVFDLSTFPLGFGQ